MSIGATLNDTRLAAYVKATRSRTYSFLAALPLFIAYEVLIRVVNAPGEAGVRVGADVWIKQALAWVGADRMFWVSLAVIAIGAMAVWTERRRRWPMRGAWFLGMLAESVVYAILVALLVSNLVAGIFHGLHAVPAMAGAPEGFGIATMLALSLGAGLYEELVFRVLLVTGMAWILERTGVRHGKAYLAAALVGALLFSAVHYIGVFGDPFTWASFTFRFLFGLALNGLYLARGFGIAAWTHALYDVFVVTGALG